MRRLLVGLAALLFAAAARAQVEEIVDVIYEINNPPSVSATHNILSTTHGDTLVASQTDGDVLTWVAVDGKWESKAPASGGAPTGAHYITNQSESGLSAEVNLGALSTGALIGTVAGGVSTISAYAGGSCTNQVVTATSAVLGLTCASVTNAMLAGSIDLTTKVTGALPIANGGTGAATVAAATIFGNWTSSTAAPAFNAPSVQGQTPKYNGSTVAFKTYPVDPATEVVLWDDFTAEPTGTGNVTFGPFQCTVSGSSSGCAVNTYAGDANTVGVAETLTGSTTTGAPYITTSKLGIFVTGNEIFKTRVYFPTSSNGTDTFAVQAGLCDQTGATACTGGSANALMFSCDENSNANWQIASVKAGTGSFSATTTPCTHSVFYDLEIDVNAAATSVAFKVNGSAVNLSPLSSNIPVAGMRFLLRTVKSAGTTSMKTDWDYGYFYKPVSR